MMLSEYDMNMKLYPAYPAGEPAFGNFIEKWGLLGAEMLYLHPV